MPRSTPVSLGFTWLIKRLIYYCYRYGCEEFEMFIYTILLYHVTWPDDYLIYDVVTLTDILITWRWYVILDTWPLTLDPWHRYLTYYHLTPDIWHLTIDMLSLDTWHMLSLSTDTLDRILWHLTGYCYTWHLYCIACSWLSPLRGLGMIIILLSDIWYSWTLVLLNSCILETL